MLCFVTSVGGSASRLWLLICLWLSNRIGRVDNQCESGLNNVFLVFHPHVLSRRQEWQANLQNLQVQWCEWMVA